MRLLITVAVALAPPGVLADCLTYEREAALTGVVRYENVATGDRAERVPTLDLNPAVCIEGQRSDRIFVRRDVASVQLVLPPELLSKVGENRRVTVLGTLSGRVTGNPRTPVLLRVRALQNAP
jgi:hypothetical protein